MPTGGTIASVRCVETDEVIAPAVMIVGLALLLVALAMRLSYLGLQRRNARARQAVGRLLPSEEVLGVAQGRIRLSRVSAAVLGVIGGVALVATGAEQAAVSFVGHLALAESVAAIEINRRVLVVTTPRDVCVVNTNVFGRPHKEVSRIPVASWLPRRSWRSVRNVVGNKVVAINTSVSELRFPTRCSLR
jgi:hypothetical protein